MRLNLTSVRGSVFAAVTLSALVACSPSDKGAADSADIGAAAADATGLGPAEVTSTEYKLPAAVDADVLGDRATEVWARVYRPKQLADGEKHPLLVFLHGNHGTCGHGANPREDDSVQYTLNGTCPDGYVVTPNHEGYGYVAERLASWGYIVVSINANRGITAGAGVSGDGGLNLARGRLVLKHLSLLSQWNQNAGSTPASLGVDLAGKLDFENVGMMGHSRGGEGVRAAYEQYRDQGSPWPARILSPLKVKAIFEIGPVDGQTSRTLDALGTAWNVVLPMCDGDVSNLQGMRPFDRMINASNEAVPNPKGMFAVWGANHNYFNTEWQESDSQGCRGANHTPIFEPEGASGSEKQRAAGMHALMGFFRAHVGANAQPAFNNAYDPQYALPPALEQVTHIGRAYSDASSKADVLVVEDFTKAAGTSLGGQPMLAKGVTTSNATPPEHDPALKASLVKWTTASVDTSLTIPWAATGDGADASTMKTLDFRTGVQNSTVASLAPQNFHIQLVNSDDTLSEKVSLGDYLTLTAAGHVILETVRIPLGDFRGANLAKVRGVKLSFDDSANGAVYVAAVRFSRAEAHAAPVTPGTPGTDATPPGAGDAVPVTTGNAVSALRIRPSADVDVELASTTAFPVLDELARLRVNGKDVTLSRYADDGSTHKIVFTMSAADFAATPDGAAIKVRYGADKATHEWDFGVLDKSAVTN